MKRLLLLALLLTLVAPGIGVLAAILLLPTLAHLPRDRMPGRPASRAMALFGIAVALPHAATLWASGGGAAEGLTMALDPALVAGAWAAQGGAWLIGEALPALLIAASDTAASRRIGALKAERERLAADWEEPEQIPG